MLRITASVVVYRTPVAELSGLFKAFERDDLRAWVVVDNAACEDEAGAGELRVAVEKHGGIYLASMKNVGFGAGHNLALKLLAEHGTDYHAMVNPDIEYGAGVMEDLQSVMDSMPDVSWVMPKVVYPDGTFQPLCRLLPTPVDFALRRFAPKAVRRLFAKRLERYEMCGVENQICDKVPFLSGCFLFTRKSALVAAGGFDERYFMYMEDVDLCRRMSRVSKVLYWPEVTIVHECYRGAYRNRRLMWIFIQSAVRYFNRWGWIFDRERREANRAALASIHHE